MNAASQEVFKEKNLQSSRNFIFNLISSIYIILTNDKKPIM